MKHSIIAALILMLTLSSYAQKVEWLSFQEAIKRNEKEPRKIIIDVYTDWCGWCKKMDAETFSNPIIAKILSEKYYAVKLDAETHDSIPFMGRVFVNEAMPGQRSSHQLAIALLQGKMSYPSIVFLDEQNRGITAVPGYKTVADMEPLLLYIHQSLYAKNVDFQKFVNDFNASKAVEK